MPIANTEVGFDKSVKSYSTVMAAVTAAHTAAGKLDAGLWRDTAFNLQILPMQMAGKKWPEVRHVPVFSCFRGGQNPQQAAIVLARMGFVVYA